MYEIFMSYTDGITGESRESSFSNSVSHYFDENGYLCNDIFDTEVLKLQNSLAADKKTKWIWPCGGCSHYVHVSGICF